MSEQRLPGTTPLSPQIERFTRHEGLEQVYYPNGLRNDDLAATFVDREGFTYLVPKDEHDFGASIELERAGLSSGEVFCDEETPIAVRFSPQTDLVNLPAVFNSSIDLDQAREDIVDVLVRTGDLLKKSRKVCGFVPTNLHLDALAVDRTSGKAELLPPFNVDEATTPEDAFMMLAEDALSRSMKQTHYYVISDCFRKASKKLDW